MKFFVVLWVSTISNPAPHMIDGYGPLEVKSEVECQVLSSKLGAYVSASPPVDDMVGFWPVCLSVDHSKGAI